MMPHSTTTATQAGSTAAPASDARWFIELIVSTSTEGGFIEIAGGALIYDPQGKPTNDIKLLIWNKHMSDAERQATPHTRKWLYVAADAPWTIDAAVAYARQIRDQFGNTYISRCLYRRGADGKPHRDENLAIPNRLVFADDVTPDRAADFSLYVQTSEHKGHAYMLMQKALGAKAYDEAARRLAVAYAADASGVDITQLVRIPNGYNTKGGQQYRVRLAHVNLEKVFTLDALRERYPAVGSPRHKREYTPTADTVAFWQDLPNGAALAASGRYRRAFENRSQLAMLLRGERVITTRKNGIKDDTLSGQRAVFVNNLLHLHQQAPENEVRALAMHYKRLIGPEMPDGDFQRRIDMLLDEYRPKDYRPEPTRFLPGGTRVRFKQKAEPRSPGRPAGQRAARLEELRAILRAELTDAQNRIVIPQQQLASRMGVDPRTMRAWLGQMPGIETGRTERGTFFVRFTDFNQPDHNAPPAEVAVCSIAAPQNDETAASLLESTELDIQAQVCILSEAPLSDPQPADHITLDALACEYLGRPAREVGREIVKRTTGEITHRRDRHHFAELVAEYGYDCDAAHGAYAAEQARLEAERLQVWREWFKWLDSRSDAELIAYVQGGCRREVDELARQNRGDFDKRLYSKRLELANKAVKRRGLVLPSKAKAKPVTPRKPATKPQPVQVQQIPLAAAVDIAREMAPAPGWRLCPPFAGRYTCQNAEGFCTRWYASAAEAIAETWRQAQHTALAA